MLDVQPAEVDDLPALHALVERAYRGESARAGWSHEADLLSGDRIDRATLASLREGPDRRLLIAWQDGQMVGCVSLTRQMGGIVYLGLLCVDPQRQAGGLGKAILAAAERVAQDELGADRIEMTVIDRRAELIAYYERRGYARTGERRPFPYPIERVLEMAVLEKRIG